MSGPDKRDQLCEVATRWPEQKCAKPTQKRVILNCFARKFVGAEVKANNTRSWNRIRTELDRKVVIPRSKSQNQGCITKISIFRPRHEHAPRKQRQRLSTRSSPFQIRKSQYLPANNSTSSTSGSTRRQVQERHRQEAVPNVRDESGSRFRRKGRKEYFSFTKIKSYPIKQEFVSTTMNPTQNRGHFQFHLFRLFSMSKCGQTEGNPQCKPN